MKKGEDYKLEEELLDEAVTAADIKKAFKVGGTAAAIMISGLFSNVYGQQITDRASHEFIKDMMGYYGQGKLDITAVFKDKFPDKYAKFVEKRGEDAKFEIHTSDFDESSEWTELPTSIQQSIWLTYAAQGIKDGKLLDSSKNIEGEVIAKTQYKFPQGKAVQTLPPLEFEVTKTKGHFEKKEVQTAFQKAFAKAVKEGKNSFEFNGKEYAVEFSKDSTPEKGAVIIVYVEGMTGIQVKD